MQILNSKAYYLKNYAVKARSKSYTKPAHSVTQPSGEGFDKKLNNLLKVQNINHLPRVGSQLRSSFSIGSNSNFGKKEPISSNKDHSNIYQKQKSILLKLLKKQKQLKKKKQSNSAVQDCVVIQNHPLGDITSFQFESMKPTDRYFHQMQNVRLAQKLLLAQPTSSINRKSLSKFYKQQQKQQKLKYNISKLSFRQSEKQRSSKTKLLSRRKWID